MNRKLDNAEKQLETAMLSPQEKCLLDLLFGEKMTEKAIHALIDGLDLDTANQNYILMLSCLGHTQGWNYFPDEMIPRLKGVHRYHQVHNAMGIPWLVQQLRTLTDAGIPVMLLKGCAMLAYYMPHMPRLMWDYDIAVPADQYDRALQLLLKNGNTLAYEVSHSAAIKGPRDEIDLHRWIFKTYGERSTDIWDRAISFDFHGIGVLVPSPEDMFIHMLDTQSRNYFRREGIERRMQWIHDCRSVWKKSGQLDLGRLAVRAEEFSAVERVRMMLALFMQYFPDLIEPAGFQRFFPQTAKYSRLLIRGEEYRKALEKYAGFAYDSQSARTPLHILRSAKMRITYYRYMGPEMLDFFFWFTRDHRIGSFAAFAKEYLPRIWFWERRRAGGE